MPPKPPQYSNIFDYAVASGRKGKSLLEVIGFRFGLGAGLSTLVAAVWICSVMTRDYPPTIACGGTLVPVIQVVVVLACLWARQLLTAGPLEERNRYLTIIAGMVSSALVFGLPPLVARVNSSDAAAMSSTVVPLIACPILTSIIALRLGSRAA